MSKVWFKACQKCKGDVFIDWDIYKGWYQSCIQCGHIRYMDNDLKIGECSEAGGAKEGAKEPFCASCT